MEPPAGVWGRSPQLRICGEAAGDLAATPQLDSCGRVARGLGGAPAIVSFKSCFGIGRHIRPQLLAPPPIVNGRLRLGGGGNELRIDDT